MKEKKISSSLQMKIRRFIEFNHEEEKYRSNLGNIVFQNLPLDLKSDMILEANLKILKNIFIFKNFSENFLKKLAMISKEISVPQDEILFEVSSNKNINYLYK